MPNNGIIYTNKRGFARRTKKNRRNSIPRKSQSLFKDKRWNKMKDEYDELFKDYEIDMENILSSEEEVERYVPKKRLIFRNKE